MNEIALAGGTSGVGHAFWDALEAQQAHAYILLTRKPIDNPKAVVVDYSDVDALKSVLEAHNVTTIISAISIADGSSGQAQLNLIKAADLSTKTKRFLPSEFGADYTPDVDVARHVMYMLDLPTWGETNFFVGERLTINEFAAMSGEVLGKFKVSCDTIEDLIAGKVTMLPAYGPPSEPLISFFSSLYLLSTKGYFDVDAAKRENSQVSSMKSIKIKDVIEAWKD
ncbi:hypothetical protein IFR05_005787 [Cadophora sp. M221]|nr:hypothetical protein IFR05_005787 [Cadophora sp. M221]